MSSPLSLLLPTGGVAVDPLAGQGASPTLSELAEAPALECTFAQSLAQQAIPSKPVAGWQTGRVIAPAATLPRGIKESGTLETRSALFSSASAGPKPAAETWLADEAGPADTARAENAQTSDTEADSPRETSGASARGFESLVPTAAEWLGWTVWPQLNLTVMEAPDAVTTQPLPEGDAPSLVVVNRGVTTTISDPAGPKSPEGDSASDASVESTVNSVNASRLRSGLSEPVPGAQGMELPGFVPVRHEADQPVGVPSENQLARAQRAARKNSPIHTEPASDHSREVPSVATEDRVLPAVNAVYSTRPDRTETSLASTKTEGVRDFGDPSISKLPSAMADAAFATEQRSLPDRTAMTFSQVLLEGRLGATVRIAQNETAASRQVGGQASADYEPIPAAMENSIVVEARAEGTPLTPAPVTSGIHRSASGLILTNWAIGETDPSVATAESSVETSARQAGQNFVSAPANWGPKYYSNDGRADEGAEPRTVQRIDEGAGSMAYVELKQDQAPQAPLQNRRSSAKSEARSQAVATQPTSEIEPPTLPGSGMHTSLGFGTESALFRMADVAAIQRSQFTPARAEQTVSEVAVTRNPEAEAARGIAWPDRGSQIADAIEPEVIQTNPSIPPGKVNSTLPTGASADPQIRSGEVRLSPLELSRTAQPGISQIFTSLPSLTSPQQPTPISNLREVVSILASGFSTNQEAPPSASTIPIETSPKSPMSHWAATTPDAPIGPGYALAGTGEGRREVDPRVPSLAALEQPLPQRFVREAEPAAFTEASGSTPPFATAVTPTASPSGNIGQTREHLLLGSDPEQGMPAAEAKLEKASLDRIAPGLAGKIPSQTEALSQEVEFNGSDRIQNQYEPSRPLEAKYASDAGNKTEPTRPVANDTRISSTTEIGARNAVPLSGGQASVSEETAIPQLAAAQDRPSAIQKGSPAEEHHTPKQEVIKGSQAAQPAAPSLPSLGTSENSGDSIVLAPFISLTDQNPGKAKQAAIPPSSEWDTEELARHSTLDSALRVTGTPASAVISRSNLPKPEDTPIAAELELPGTSLKQTSEGKPRQGAATFSDTPEPSTASTASEKAFLPPTRETRSGESAAFEPEFDLSAEPTNAAKASSIRAVGRPELQVLSESRSPNPPHSESRQQVSPSTGPVSSVEPLTHRPIETRISSAEFRLVRSWQGRTRSTTTAPRGGDSSIKPSDVSPTFEPGPAKTAPPTLSVEAIRETVVSARLARPPESEGRTGGDFEPRPKPAPAVGESGVPDRADFEPEVELPSPEGGPEQPGVAALGKEHRIAAADPRHRRGGIPVAKADVMQAQPIEGTHRTESSAPRSTVVASNTSAGGMDLRKDAPEGAASIARASGLEGFAPWELKPAERLEAAAPKSAIGKPSGARTIPELAGEIALHAGQVRDLKLDSMMVVLRADSDTQIAVQLVRVADVIEVKARIERGDLPGLTNRWSELQQSLAVQGIRLHDFESKPRQNSHFEQNASNSNAQDEAGRQPREQARRQAGGETSAEPMPARRTSSIRTIKSGTRAGTWELWA